LLGTNALPAVPRLLSLAQEADPATRRQAYSCLASIGLQRQALIPLLTPLLQHPNQVIASEARAYLWVHYGEELRAEGLEMGYVTQFGPGSSNAVPRVQRELRSVRTNAPIPWTPIPAQSAPEQ
jgi:hypothetical protein